MVWPWNWARFLDAANQKPRPKPGSGGSVSALCRGIKRTRGLFACTVADGPVRRTAPEMVSNGVIPAGRAVREGQRRPHRAPAGSGAQCSAVGSQPVFNQLEAGRQQQERGGDWRQPCRATRLRRRGEPSPRVRQQYMGRAPATAWNIGDRRNSNPICTNQTTNNKTLTTARAACSSRAPDRRPKKSTTP